jgi:hypothetical protein
MTKNVFRLLVAGFAVGFSSLLTADASAQCCGGGAAYQPTAAYYQPTTAYYQPAAYTSYYAPTYQTYRPMFGGWYPGKVLGRINRAIWGVPETYAAAYPTTYAAAYPTAYTASYPATYTASYPSYTASYAPSYSVGYATTSYAAPVSYSAPACTTCAMPVCDPCATCGVATSGVTQAVYEQRADCPTCAPNYSQSTTSQQPAEAASPPTTYGQQNSPDPAPGISPDANVPEQREEAQRQPLDNGTGASETPNDLQPEATPENSGGVEGSSTSLEAPPLYFNSQDRAAQRSPAPVRTAVLPRSASHAPTSAAPISWQQAHRDAAGWVSASE